MLLSDHNCGQLHDTVNLHTSFKVMILIFPANLKENEISKECRSDFNIMVEKTLTLTEKYWKKKKGVCVWGGGN